MYKLYQKYDENRPSAKSQYSKWSRTSCDQLVIIRKTSEDKASESSHTPEVIMQPYTIATTTKIVCHNIQLKSIRVPSWRHHPPERRRCRVSQPTRAEKPSNQEPPVFRSRTIPREDGQSPRCSFNCRQDQSESSVLPGDYEWRHSQLP